ncbi:hypothetical protein SLEP1_g56144 [Rubroshorea leprosula]|uniref:Uncharacterized protein n=1 Tax=Rubroshorea leprosula TaxID=152421 RepID=A0AAV5MHP6_9ROSI|nr:hypothetical protein SLEP1_g56144 [Rubroshorea leprosula]
MIEAERLLLAGALEDPVNQRFFLLSDSCLPLYSFSYIYKYLMASPRRYVDRYSLKMLPIIPKDKWRKGSQWISLVRSRAEVVINDEIIFPVSKKLRKKLQKQHNCIPDAHYMQTLFAISELERRTLTYTLWNQSATKMENNWHCYI